MLVAVMATWAWAYCDGPLVVVSGTWPGGPRALVFGEATPPEQVGAHPEPVAWSELGPWAGGAVWLGRFERERGRLALELATDKWSRPPVRVRERPAPPAPTPPVVIGIEASSYAWTCSYEYGWLVRTREPAPAFFVSVWTDDEAPLQIWVEGVIA
jgi:hypothetical protein